MNLKNVVGLALLSAMMFCFSACTDYEGVVDDKYEDWLAGKDGSDYDSSTNTLKDLRDNQVYKTVKIGTQTWMAENLNYNTGNSWCYLNNASNCDKYGRLYTWSAVMDSAAKFSANARTKCGYGVMCTPNSPHRGICPEGWHVPTNEEFSALFTYIGGTTFAGLLLKSTSGWATRGWTHGNGTDKYGFSVLPAGDRNNNGGFSNEGYYAYLWTASDNYYNNAWNLSFKHIGDDANQGGGDKNNGFSLRCLRDSSPTSGDATSSSSQALPSSSSSSEKSGSSSSREKDGSSSSVAPNSSSSVILSDSEGSSSSSAKSSSSVASSSSVKSSSSVASSFSVKSSSSIASSSSAKSSSSVASCSSVKSSSSIASSSSAKSSSSIACSSSMKVAWTYLNPSISYGEIVDSRDNQVYKTVSIGSQTWMAENLNYDPGNVSSMGSYAWSGCYDNKADSCAKYGRLYTWEVAMDNASCAYGETCNASLNSTTPVRGVCPQGWHLPSHYEFGVLIKYSDPSFRYNNTTAAKSSIAGKYLKSMSGWNSSGNGSDIYGFSALPGGFLDNDGVFSNVSYEGNFWSSSEDYSDNAFYLRFYFYDEQANLDFYRKNYAKSVRCLKD